MTAHTRVFAAPLAGAIGIFLSVSALAADKSPAPNVDASAEAKARAEAAARVEPQQVAVDELVGRRVLGESGEDVGDINAVIVSKEGQVSAVVVGVGGFLGLGEKEVAVPWERMTLGENGHRITLSMTKEQLERLPAYIYPDNQRPRTAFLDPAYHQRAEAHAGTVAAPTDPRSDQAVAMRAGNRSDIGGKPPADKGWSRALGADGKIRAASFVGTEVMNGDNEAIGEIEDVLIAQGGAPQVLVSVGGFLGIGERRVVLNWNQLSIDRNNESVRVAVDMDKRQLEKLPAYKE